MIIDVTGIVLTPGYCGAQCLGNGLFVDINGEPIECCCDECSYLMCCIDTHDETKCTTCKDERCPRSPLCNDNDYELAQPD